MTLHRNFFLFLFFFLSLQVFSQGKFKGDSYNRLGLQGGVTYGGIKSSSVPTVERLGFTAGFTTRANTYENIIVVYGVNFFKLSSAVQLVEKGASTAREIDFATTGVQLKLFGGYKLIGEHLSIQGGPVLQLNGKWKPEAAYEGNRVEGFNNLIASDLENISPLNLNVAGSLTTGFRSFKLSFQYQYGITNAFRSLNTAELQQKDSRATNLKGHMKFATAGLIFYF